MPSKSFYRRPLLLVVLAVLLAGCDGERLVGTWQATYDGEEHVIKLTGSGRMWRSSDLVGGDKGWTSWKATEELGSKVWISVGGHKMTATFDDIDHMLIYDSQNQLRIDFERIDKKTEEEQDSRSYAASYSLVILAVTFGLIAVCRPSRREEL